MKRQDIKKFLCKDIGPVRLGLLLVCGIALVLLSVPGSSEDASQGKELKKEKEQESAAERARVASYDAETYLAMLEDKVSAILSQVEGAGAVSVMLMTQAGAENIVLYDKDSEEKSIHESDAGGGSRNQNEQRSTQSVALVDGEMPYVTQQLLPAITGALIVAEGAGNPSVRAELTGAVQALFSLETHKIKVLKRGIGS